MPESEAAPAPGQESGTPANGEGAGSTLSVSATTKKQCPDCAEADPALLYVCEDRTARCGTHVSKGGGTMKNLAPHTLADRDRLFGAKAPRATREEPKPRIEATLDDDLPANDLGNARRLVRDYGALIRYVKELGWLSWDGRRWSRDAKGEVYRFAKRVIDSLASRAEVPDSDQQKSRRAFAKQSGSEPSIRRMVKLAETEPEIAMRPEDFDADPFLLNCLNGTLDLRTQELRRHDPEDRITKVTGADFDPKAKAQTWQTFLRRILPGDADLAGFLQKAAGYSIGGGATEQVLFICYGTGANGKTTYFEATSGAAGDYHARAQSESFLERRGDGLRNDLARLAGTRYVTAIESGEGRRLAEALIKQLTGGDKLTARFMFKEFFEFRPDFKIWIAANHKPEIRGTDYAMWRRLRLIPFTVTIPDSEIDRSMGEKLTAEASGILAWMVEGFRLYGLEGLAPPQAVQDATATYKAEMDVLADFLAACCVQDKEASVLAKDLYTAYRELCRVEGDLALTQGKFGRRLRDKGFSNEKGKTARTQWNGLSLSAEGVGLAQAGADRADDPLGRRIRQSRFSRSPEDLTT